MGNKLIFYIQGVWVWVWGGYLSLLPVLYPCFKIGKNPNRYSNPIKAGKTCQNGFGSGEYPQV